MAKTRTIHDFELATIDGAAKKLADYSGQVLLVVNVASKCGLTPHYQGLQELYEENKARGFAVLGFPCNQFGGQEPGSDAEVKSFCATTYGVTFPMFSKIDVNGAGRAPLYAWLTGEQHGARRARRHRLELHQIRDRQGRRREGALQPARRAGRPRAARRDRRGARGIAHPMDATSIAANGWRFDALCRGPADGALVLLLHGFPQTAHSWRRVAAGARARGLPRRGAEPARRLAGRAARGARGLRDRAARGRRDRHRRRARRAALPPGRPRLGRRARVAGRGAPPGSTALARASPRRPTRSRSAARSTIPRRPGAALRLHGDVPHRGRGRGHVARARRRGPARDLRRGRAQRGGGGALRRGVLRARGAHRVPELVPRRGSGRSRTARPCATPTLYVWSTGDPALGREAAEWTRDYVLGDYRFEVLEGIDHWIPEHAAGAAHRAAARPLRARTPEHSSQARRADAPMTALMAVPCAKGSIVVGAVASLRHLRSSGRITERAAGGAPVRPRRSMLLEEKIDIGRWYPMSVFAELVDFEWDVVAGRDPEYARQSGAKGAQRLFQGGRYQQLDFAQRAGTRGEPRRAGPAVEADHHDHLDAVQLPRGERRHRSRAPERARRSSTRTPPSSPSRSATRPRAS